jgi:hypothetical protein
MYNMLIYIVLCLQFEQVDDGTQKYGGLNTWPLCYICFLWIIAAVSY